MFKIRNIYIYAILTVIFAVGVLACENISSKMAVYQADTIDDDPISNIEIAVGKTTLRVDGGSGTYNVCSSDSEVLSAWVANDYLHITGKKTGVAELAIVDDSSQTIVLKVVIQPKIRLFSVQDSRAEIEVEARTKEGKLAINAIEDLIKGQLKTKGMYYKFIYDELNSGKVMIYPKGLIDEFKIEGTFESSPVTAGQTLFEINVNGYVREYNLIETKSNADFSLKKGLFVENYSNDFTFEGVKMVKALGVEVVFYQ